MASQRSDVFNLNLNRKCCSYRKAAAFARIVCGAALVLAGWDTLRAAAPLDPPTTRAAVSPGGTLLATGGRSIELWSLPAFARVRTLGPADAGPAERTFSLAFSADGKTLLSSATDGVVRLWDVDTGKPRLAINVGA